MERPKLSKAMKALEGLSYPDWIKLRMAVDSYYEIKKSELAKTIQLTSAEEIERLIQSQFG